MKFRSSMHLTPLRERLFRAWRSSTGDYYTYETLPSDTSIRVLELLPGQADDPIQCHLLAVGRTSAPEYEAISYAWGDPKDKSTIICNGKKLEIQTTLRDALRRIREPTERKFLWADAVCINQSDRQERGHQVKQMGWIYSNAERVLVWLGPWNPFEIFGDDVDMETLIETCSKKKYYDVSPSNSFLDIPSFEDDPDFHRFWSRLRKLLHRPWFQRLWVVQEAGLGRSVLVLCGNMQMDFDRLMSLVGILRNRAALQAFFDINSILAEGFQLFPNRAHDTVMFAEGVDFLEVMYLTRNKMAADPRDYIYALLGHPSASISEIPLPKPDYTQPHSQVIRDLAAKLIAQTQSLRVLSAVHHLNEKDLSRVSPSCTPSWVPTWNRDWFNSFGVMREDSNYFDAAAGFPMQATTSKNILRAEGFIFDTVDECTVPMEWNDEERRWTYGHWPIEAAMSFRTSSLFQIQDWLLELSQTLTIGRYKLSMTKTEAERYLLADFAAYRLQLMADATQSGLIPEGLAAAQAAAEGGQSHNFRLIAECWSVTRKLFSTRSGMLGLGPKVLRPGDICCILFGHWVPFILRPAGSEYKLVGEAYIPKVMQGEAVVDLMLGEKFATQTFEIS